MEYKILNIVEQDNGFEVEIEFELDNEKKRTKFVFMKREWANEMWKRTIEAHLARLETTHKIQIDKTKYIGKKFDTKSYKNTDIIAEAAIEETNKKSK